MDGDEEAPLSADQPKCATCGRLARLITTIPAIDEFPEIKVFECLACGIIDCLRGQQT